MIRAVAIAILLALLPVAARACDGPVAVCDGATKGYFALVDHGVPATVYVDAAAEKPVLRVADDFADDLQRVSGTRPQVVHSLDGVTGDVVVIGEAGQVAGLADGGAIAGKWEAYQQSVVPLKNGRRALVILGADKRGAIYGTYDISAKMGVSPWYWWADVPVAHKDNLLVMDGTRSDAPKVKYRGFFINDEDPAFGGWAKEKYGGVNHQVYAKVFELDLRLKGNFLWPAMWGRSIADDDPESLATADDYGIVLGTSHHEPMTRAQVEWHRHTDQGVTGGAWDYTKNADNLRAFWRGGIERMVEGHHEDLVTIGMRGDGDEPMSEGTATALLEQIVSDQRQIIADVTGKPADQTPQVWALYKEVQDYYDHGMQVPDDVTLLFSDDNWGDIRRLPKPDAAPRAGGYGVYYHFDYVGGPRNYKWINTNQIEKTWQQMDLAYDSGVDRLWVVNVGDIKPMEYPLSFFMDMAWNPKAMTPDALKAYPAQWATQQFGPDHAQEIGEILTRYSQYNARRKPELLDSDAFGDDVYAGASLLTATAAYDTLAAKTAKLQKIMSIASRDAWYQLVEYPVAASANLYDLYQSVGQNHEFAGMDDAHSKNTAETFANQAEADFRKDAELSAAYNGLAHGKWDHMMDQTHIGYTGWQQPDTNVMPAVLHFSKMPEPDYATVVTGAWKALPPRPGIVFTDTFGYVAIEAEHYARKFDGGDVHWVTVPDLGRTLSSVISYPQAAPPTTVEDGVRLEYDIDLQKAADATLSLYLAPTLDTRGGGGLKVAVAIDNGPAQTLSFDLNPEDKTSGWDHAVSDNIVVLKAAFPGLSAGRHTIKVFRIDPNVVLERLVLDTGGLKPSYLGPPESGTAP